MENDGKLSPMFTSRGNVMENVNVWMSEFSDLGQEVEKKKSVLMK